MHGYRRLRRSAARPIKGPGARPMSSTGRGIYRLAHSISSKLTMVTAESTTAGCWQPRSPSGQGLVEVGNELLDGFDACRKANQVLRHAGFGAILGG